MRILNLYAGIGGNRKLWGDDHDITSVEKKEEIANVYKDFFPNDEVIVGDAHEYLLENFEKFDFIWTSPPCPSHSRVRKANTKQNKPLYPDMKLYEEIIFLKHYFKGNWVVENVKSYYEPLIYPYDVGMHYFWSNYHIFEYNIKTRNMDAPIEKQQEVMGFDLSKYTRIDKRLALRNAIEPNLGKHVFDCQFNRTLFN